MEKVLEKYLDKIIEQNRIIDARGVMQVSRIVELELDEIYVNLTARIGARENIGSGKITFPLTKISGRGRTIINADGTMSEQNPLNDNDDIKSNFTFDDGLDYSQGLTFDEITIQKPGRINRSTEQREESGLSLDDLWARNNNWTLLGDPGSGKTTVIKHIALTHARRVKNGGEEGLIPIPVIVRFFSHEWALNKEWKSKDAALKYIANHGLEELGITNENERYELTYILQQKLAEGKCILLFDGLDEQRDVNIKEKTNKAIEKLVNSYPGNRSLATSRIIGYSSATLGGGFDESTLEPFTDEQMRDFFYNWEYAMEKREDVEVDDTTKARAKRNADELLEHIEANPSVRALTSNPLLCTIIGLIHRQGATLPQQRAELYKLCIDTFIFNWEMHKRKQRIERESLDKDETQSALEAIALYLHENTQENRAAAGQIINVIKDKLAGEMGYPDNEAEEKSKRLLKLIRDVAGLFVDRGNNEYGFFHLTFQEYLAARAVTNKRSLIEKYLEKYLFNPRWREVILLAASHQGMKDQEAGTVFINTILAQKCEYDEELQRAFRIAFQCVREGARIERATLTSLFQKWCRLYLDKPELENLHQKATAHANSIYQVGDDAISPLVEALEDENPVKRSSAVSGMSCLKISFTTPYLITALKEDKSDYVRQSAADALGAIKDKEALLTLINALKVDKSDYVRRSAADALGAIKDKEALPTLINALKVDKDCYVRGRAAYALGAIKDKEALPTLINALKVDKEDYVRGSAADALGTLKDKDGVASLINALKVGKSDSVRRRAANSLDAILTEGNE